MRPVLIVGYPLVCHLGALSGDARLGLAWLGVVFAATARRRVLSDVKHAPFFDHLRGPARSGLR